MNVLDLGGWRFFIGNIDGLKKEKTGKWMYFYKDQEGQKYAEERCQEAVELDLVGEAKRSDNYEGVACFYLNIDDLDRHKQIIQYFLDHDMIRRTKSGKLYNISFKLDDQTRAGAYGDDFIAELKLDSLMDLYTGEWLV